MHLLRLRADALRRLLEQFEEIEDPYLRERKADVVQVVERILKRLMGKNFLADTPFEIAGAARHGGSSLWVAGPEGLDSAALATRLIDVGVLIEPGLPFFADPPPICRHFRMGYSSIAEADIRRGVALIAQTAT